MQLKKVLDGLVENMPEPRQLDRDFDRIREAEAQFRLGLQQRLTGSLPYVQANRSLEVGRMVQDGRQLLTKGASAIVMHAIREGTRGHHHYGGFLINDFGIRGDQFAVYSSYFIVSLPHIVYNNLILLWILYHEAGHIIADLLDVTELVQRWGSAYSESVSQQNLRHFKGEMISFLNERNKKRPGQERLNEEEIMNMANLIMLDPDDAFPDEDLRTSEPTKGYEHHQQESLFQILDAWHEENDDSPYVLQKESIRPHTFLIEIWADQFAFRFGFYGDWPRYVRASIAYLNLPEVAIREEGAPKQLLRLFAVFMSDWIHDRRSHGETLDDALDDAQQESLADLFIDSLKTQDAAEVSKPFFEQLKKEDAGAMEEQPNWLSWEDLIRKGFAIKEIYILLLHYGELIDEIIPDKNPLGRTREWLEQSTLLKDYLKEPFIHFPDQAPKEDVTAQACTIWNLTPRELLYSLDILEEQRRKEEPARRECSNTWCEVQANIQYKMLHLLRGAYSTERKHIYENMPQSA